MCSMFEASYSESVENRRQFQSNRAAEGSRWKTSVLTIFNETWYIHFFRSEFTPGIIPENEREGQFSTNTRAGLAPTKALVNCEELFAGNFKRSECLSENGGGI